MPEGYKRKGQTSRAYSQTHDVKGTVTQNLNNTRYDKDGKKYWVDTAESNNRGYVNFQKAAALKRRNNALRGVK